MASQGQIQLTRCPQRMSRKSSQWREGIQLLQSSLRKWRCKSPGSVCYLVCRENGEHQGSTYVVEANGRHHHQSEANHTIAHFQTNPCVWRWMTSAKTKDPHPRGSKEQARNDKWQSSFCFCHTMRRPRRLLDAPVRNQCGVDEAQEGADQCTNIDKADLLTPEVGRSCEYLWSDC